MSRSGLDIKKAIIKELRGNECSLRELETKINTNYLTIRIHCTELEFLKIVELIKHKESEVNGRPYTSVKLTEFGKKL